MNYIEKKLIDKCASITILSTGKEGHTKKMENAFVRLFVAGQKTILQPLGLEERP